jgi:hypothetical protein
MSESIMPDMSDIPNNQNAIATNEQLAEEMLRMQSMIADLQNRLHQQSNHLAQQQQGNNFTERLPRPKVALPEKFHGKRKDFDNFLTQTELIMRLRPDQYPNDFYKIGLTCW